jgi:diaminopimelate epimerase
MKHTFYKYQGTGNDFIIFDNRQHELDFLTKNQIKSLCDRRFGIGADGLMLLENHPDFDFKMVYYNADGGESSMCGNGGRCLVDFAKFLHIIDSETNFLAVDGAHYAKISENLVSLKMIDVTEINTLTNALSLNSGSPHYVQFVNEINHFPVFAEGKKIRNSAAFMEEGINVNFVEKLTNGLFVRTYERGVEDETLSCGTGVTAAAIAYAYANNLTNEQSISVETLGGKLAVSFNYIENKFTDVYLKGPAVLVYSGSVAI